jgi:hypothetical protein
MSTMKVRHCGAHLFAEASNQWSGSAFEHGHLIVELLCGCCDFEANKTCPDYDNAPTTGTDSGPNGHGVVKRAQHMDMTELRLASYTPR